MFKKLALLLILILIIGCSENNKDKNSTAEGYTLVDYNEDIKNSLMSIGLQPAIEPFAATDFTLSDLYGNLVTLNSRQGKVVFLNFWATWCGPCRAEMPSMQQLYEKYKDKGLEILAVNLREDAGLVQDFIQENNYTFTVLLDKTGEIGSIYVGGGIPTSYIVDREGLIIARIVGSREWNTEQVFAVFDKLLAND